MQIVSTVKDRLFGRPLIGRFDYLSNFEDEGYHSETTNQVLEGKIFSHKDQRQSGCR